MTGSGGENSRDLRIRIGHHIALEADRDNFRGRCPLHPDVWRSLYVHPDQPIFHCFACGASGGHEQWSAILRRL